MNPYTSLLPLFCFLSFNFYSCAASAAAPPTNYLQKPPTLILAADALGSRGYTIFSTLLISLSTATNNFSGTLFAPPDFAFSAASNFVHRRSRSPPPPTMNLLLHHTVKAPLVLTWIDLSSGDDGAELPTFYDSNCLYLYKNPYGGSEVSISPYPLNNPLDAVTIRQPDIYVDDTLTVHGVDAVLHPAYATKCDIGRQIVPTPSGIPRQANWTFLDRAIRALKMRGGNSVVATAMSVRKSELASLNSFTVLAVPDQSLFLNPDGFRYDFRHHVLPMLYRTSDLASAVEGSQLVTLSPSKVVRVCNGGGVVHINGAAVDEVEVYISKRISVITIANSMDDSVDVPCSLAVSEEDFSNSIAFPPISSSAIPPAPAPANSKIGIPDSVSIRNFNASGLANFTVIAPWEIPILQNTISAPTPSPVNDEVISSLCELGGTVDTMRVEGEDVSCSVSTHRKLLESEASSGGHVEVSEPLDVDGQSSQDLTGKFRKGKSVNVADDIFFYI